VLGRETTSTSQHKRNGVGYAFVHAAVDDHSRLAYAEVHSGERKETTIAFWGRMRAFFADHGVEIAVVMTDNGGNYRSKRLFG
jgi:hypothetical protein